MRTDLGKRVQKIEEQMHVRKYPNRPLTEEEEAFLREWYQKEADGLCKIDLSSELTEEEEAALRAKYGPAGRA